jgi:hypothetical protein
MVILTRYRTQNRILVNPVYELEQVARHL